jgi:holliday junction DNA helicase RuvA
MNSFYSNAQDFSKENNYVNFVSMIAYLKGSFINKTPSSVIIDAGGVGYDVNISLNTFSAIQHLQNGLLYTHLIIKEDAHLLYGFSDPQEKGIFLTLIGVSGIGANTARLILSYMKPDEIVYAIATGDSRAFEKIKGIGKKTAERAVLELKDKIGKSSTGIVVPAEKGSTVKQDALEALAALGINKIHAEQILTKILLAEPQLSIEELIKRVLKGL